MRAGKTPLALLALLALATLPLGARGEAAYVVDRILVGVHEDNSLDSIIVKVLPTGTVMEILSREGDLAEVRAEDGTTGWIDASYLMAEKPAKVLALELEAEKEQTEEALEQARTEVEALRTRLEEQTARAAPRGVPMTSEALREMERLSEENQALKTQIAALEPVPGSESEAAETVEFDDVVEGAPAPAAGNPRVHLAHLGFWQQTLLGSLLLLAFGLGGYLVEKLLRMRNYLVDRGPERAHSR